LGGYVWLWLMTLGYHDPSLRAGWGEVSEASLERLRLVDRAVRTWTGELIDLGGRNTLLYYRDLNQGTLDIGPGSPADGDVVGALLSSRTIRLSMMFGSSSMTAAARRPGP